MPDSDESAVVMSPAARRWWRITVAAAAAVCVTVGILAAIVLGGTDAKPGARPELALPGGSQTQSEVPIEPGQFARPSLPGTDPADPWRGAKPISGVDPDVVRTALTGPWGLDFRTRRLLGGVRLSGIAGDGSRKQRRLDAVVDMNNDNTVYQVMCQAGGTEVAPVEDRALVFVSDCLAAAVRGESWPTLKTWLDQNLPALAQRSGSTWYRMPTVRMYVESSRNIISCTLTNI